eukprot:m.172303 g.172303  ORF g.172303 m.172303 type:complete len:67 (+) comp13500_c0_seq1:176-376(+)
MIPARALYRHSSKLNIHVVVATVDDSEGLTICPHDRHGCTGMTHTDERLDVCPCAEDNVVWLCNDI